MVKPESETKSNGNGKKKEGEKAARRGIAPPLPPDVLAYYLRKYRTSDPYGPRIARS